MSSQQVKDTEPSNLVKRARPNDSEDEGEEKVFVSNLDYHLKLSTLKTFFGDKLGPCKVHMKRHPDGRFKGFAVVEFETEGAAERALKLDKSRLEGRPVFISPFQPDAATRQRVLGAAQIQHTGRNPKVLYVSRLPVGCTEDHLKSIFKRYSGLKEVRMQYRKSGRFRGCAYVEFLSPANAVRALAADGSEIEGSKISVAICDPPKKSQPHRPAINLNEATQDELSMEVTLSELKDEVSLEHTNEDLKTASKEDPKTLFNDDFRLMLGLE